MKHSDVFKVLKPLALDISDRRFRHVAAVVYRNKIISYGMSNKKSHPFQSKYSKNIEAIFWHAETNSIFNALKRVDVDTLKKCTLYVCRVKHEDTAGDMMFGMSKPCIGCQECIDEYQIPTIVYTLDGKFGRHRYAVDEPE
jgi:deoxycytidylate deaminase